MTTGHGQQNALAWLETITEGMTALGTLEAEVDGWGLGGTPVTHDDETYHDPDALREALQDYALSVRVRGGWHTSGDDRGAPVEYEILLTTGGPALRIRGDLGELGNPTSARLEYQDCGTPWAAIAMSSDEADALLKFASLFYLGDGY